MSGGGVEWRFQDSPTGTLTMNPRPERNSMSRFRRISGIFEQTATEVRENANHVLNTVVVPASDTGQKYAAEQPVKATFFAMVTFLSFLPVLLFVVFVVGVVVFVTFTSVSFAITSTTLAFTLGGALLAISLLACVAPASLLFTGIAFVAVSLVRLGKWALNYGRDGSIHLEGNT